MGLVKAALGAASGVMGDQWKEYFYCSALPAEVLAVKGQKNLYGCCCLPLCRPYG